MSIQGNYTMEGSKMTAGGGSGGKYQLRPLLVPPFQIWKLKFTFFTKWKVEERLVQCLLLLDLCISTLAFEGCPYRTAMFPFNLFSLVITFMWHLCYNIYVTANKLFAPNFVWSTFQWFSNQSCWNQLEKRARDFRAVENPNPLNILKEIMDTLD